MLLLNISEELRFEVLERMWSKKINLSKQRSLNTHVKKITSQVGCFLLIEKNRREILIPWRNKLLLTTTIVLIFI